MKKMTHRFDYIKFVNVCMVKGIINEAGSQRDIET